VFIHINININVNINMSHSKIAFVQFKGIGDLLIAVNYLDLKNNPNFIILSSDKNSKILSIIKTKNKFETVNFNGRVPAFYNLRKFNLNLIRDIIVARNAIRRMNKLGYKCLIDLPFLRNRIIFFGLNILYLPCKNNIYNSYSSFFKFSIPYAPVTRLENIAIFPCGSSPDRTLQPELILNLSKELSDNLFNFSFLIHTSHQALFPSRDYSVKYFNDMNEFDTLIKNYDGLITVDSMALHRAYTLNIYIYVITEAWKLYIPNPLLEKNVFNFSDSKQLINKVISDRIESTLLI